MNMNLNNPFIISQLWEDKLNAAYPLAVSHYGSVEQLLDILCAMLMPYLQVPGIFQCLEDGGLRPYYMLDVTHPACLVDAMAMHCLQSYEPAEADHAALQRCIVDLLHQNLTQMERADLSTVQTDQTLWVQYALDALLRLVWRYQGCQLQIPFYLQKDTSNQLSDQFLLVVNGNWVCLTQCTHNRHYEVNTEELDYPSFCQHICRNFQLATEDYGYFVPKHIWLSHTKINKEECYD